MKRCENDKLLGDNYLIHQSANSPLIHLCASHKEANDTHYVVACVLVVENFVSLYIFEICSSKDTDQDKRAFLKVTVVCHN